MNANKIKSGICRNQSMNNQENSLQGIKNKYDHKNFNCFTGQDKANIIDIRSNIKKCTESNTKENNLSYRFRKQKEKQQNSNTLNRYETYKNDKVDIYNVVKSQRKINSSIKRKDQTQSQIKYGIKANNVKKQKGSASVERVGKIKKNKQENEQVSIYKYKYATPDKHRPFFQSPLDIGSKNINQHDRTPKVQKYSYNIEGKVDEAELKILIQSDSTILHKGHLYDTCPNVSYSHRQNLAKIETKGKFRQNSTSFKQDMRKSQQKYEVMPKSRQFSHKNCTISQTKEAQIKYQAQSNRKLKKTFSFQSLSVNKRKYSTYKEQQLTNTHRIHHHRHQMHNNQKTLSKHQNNPNELRWNHQTKHIQRNSQRMNQIFTKKQKNNGNDWKCIEKSENTLKKIRSILLQDHHNPKNRKNYFQN